MEDMIARNTGMIKANKMACKNTSVSSVSHVLCLCLLLS